MQLRILHLAAVMAAASISTPTSAEGNTGRLTCDARELSEPTGCALAYGDLSFNVSASNLGSINQLTIQSSGLELGNPVLIAEIDGSAYKSELADLDRNGWPELYIYVSSAGSGSYGSLVAYAVNHGKSMTPIYLRPITEDAAAGKGYMGHDAFAIVENRLLRRFPIYRDKDTNSAPTGGTRQLEYRLVPGEAGWILVTDQVMEY